jgi:hypothetical protein
MSRLLRCTGAVAAALLSFAAAPAAAQSLLASRGLGYPIEPLDARSRGLGGITTGLGEPLPSLVNPASAVGIPAFAFVAAVQPDHFTATTGGESSSASTVRFPLLLAVFPVSQRLVAQVGYGAYLDQHWQVEQTDSITLSTGPVEVQDRFSSEGGIARFQAGLGYQVTPRLALGVSLDAFSGAAHDSAVRTITGLVPAGSEVTYRYSGLAGGLGVRWVATSRIAASAAVHGGGRVHAEADSLGTEAKDYDNPLRVDAGAAGRIGNTLTLVASGQWAGWSSANDALAASGGARDVTGFGGGVEYGGFSLFRKVVPLRLGARYAQLPFRWSNSSEFPTERAITAGIGYSLSSRSALFDAAVERGSRGGSAAGIDEPYWRFSFSLSVLGR